MSPADERLEILEMIQRGTISAEEGLKLIEALGNDWDGNGCMTCSFCLSRLLH